MFERVIGEACRGFLAWTSQRLEILGGRERVRRRHVLRAVDDDVAHRAEGNALRIRTSLEKLRQLFRTPSTESSGATVTQTGCKVVLNDGSRKVGGASGRCRRFHLHRERTRRVTFAAVSQPLDKIGSLRQLRVHSGWRREGLRARREEPAPEGQRPTHRQGKHDVVRPIRNRRRRDPVLEVRIQRGNIVRTCVVVRGEGHRRIQTVALGDAEAKRAVEIIQRHAPDAVVRIRRDIVRIDGTDRNTHAQAARVGWLAGNTVAGRAIAEPGKIRASSNQVWSRSRCDEIPLTRVAIRYVGDAHREQQPREADRHYDQGGLPLHACTKGLGDLR